MLAPIVLFTYNRLKEAQFTIEALKNNEFANESELYIFSDGSKNDTDKNEVCSVREFLRSITGFKKVQIIESSNNKGLANSIITGIKEIFQSYQKVIVIEDDLIVSKDFLSYMNNALDCFESRDDIWSIAGYCPPIKLPSHYKKDIFLFGRASSHGWGTWKNRWDSIDWNVSDFKQFSKNKILITKFNNTGNDMFKMLELQQLGKINSWAIRWCYAQFKNSSYTVYPRISKVQITGYNENATHKGINYKRHFVTIDSLKLLIDPNVSINEEIIFEFKTHQDLDYKGKIGYFLRKNNLAYKKVVYAIERVKTIFKFV